MFRTCALGGALLLLAACRSLYVPPTAGPVAKLRFQIDDSARSVSVGVWSNGFCRRPAAGMGAVGPLGAFTAAHLESERSKLQMLGGTDQVDVHRFERLVPAGRPLELEVITIVSVQFGPGIQSTTCQQDIQFTPLPERQYEVSHAVLGKSCVIVVNELVARPGGFDRLTVKDVTRNQCPR